MLQTILFTISQLKIIYHEFEKSNAKVIQQKMYFQVFVVAKATTQILMDPSCKQRS